MGTINKRTRKDGSVGYTAQIVKKKGGKTIFSEAETFDRRGAAEAWMRRREGELAQPGGLKKALGDKMDATIREIIERYETENEKTIGETQAGVLKAIKTYPIADKLASETGSEDFVALARALHDDGRAPSTVGGYLSHLKSPVDLARAAWGIPLDPRALVEGRAAATKLGLVGMSNERDRRPTLKELDKLMEYFARRHRSYPDTPPVHKIIAYAIFSCRRQEEICSIREPDMDAKQLTQIVRSMKDPRRKQGNDIVCEITPQALAIAQSMPPSEDGRIFPFNHRNISQVFSEACFRLGINTEEMPDEERLHFHDMRHEGVSRLFEMDYTIARVAAHSGHKSWNTLKRYTQIRGRGDKFRGWRWLPIVTAKGWTPLLVEASTG